LASTRQFGETAIGRDLNAIRPFFWLPVATTAFAVTCALILSLFLPSDGEARFRSTIVVDALPPLFGPPVVPGPFEFTGLATSDAVVRELARQTGTTPEDLGSRLHAKPRANTPQIDVSVKGDDALPIAEAWERIFIAAVPEAAPDIQSELLEPYRTQLEQARLQLTQATLAFESGDAASVQRLGAAEENYATASRLVQSYEIVGGSMRVAAITVEAPHMHSGGLGSTRARVGAALATGVVSGVAGAMALAYIRGRADDDDDSSMAPPSLRRVETRAGSASR
jgi:hypothetical protein